jgi:hypothetical protein
MSFYEQDIKDAVKARAAIYHEISGVEFGMHLCMMYGWDAEHAIRVMRRCVQAGLMWVGQNYPRRGRQSYAVLTGLGKRLAAELCAPSRPS